jgi:hypothetical protein
MASQLFGQLQNVSLPIVLLDIVEGSLSSIFSFLIVTIMCCPDTPIVILVQAI